jgi:hypothetical protein
MFSSTSALPLRANGRRGLIFDLSLLVISLAFAAIYVVHGDAGAGFVAYVLLLWRAWSAFRQQRRYAKVYRSILRSIRKGWRNLDALLPANQGADQTIPTVAAVKTKRAGLSPRPRLCFKSVGNA